MRPRASALLLPAALIVALGAYLVEGTPVGRAALAYVRTPDLTTSAADPQVSFEPGAEPLANEIAAVLPTAIHRVEMAEQMHFSTPAAVRVYSRWDSFEKYTGSRRGPAAVTDADRVSFSPKLLDEPERVGVIVTHELTHALLHQRMGSGSVTLPAWFDEGLATLVSDGTGVEAVSVSESDAIAAIRRGRRFTPDDDESFFVHRYGASFGLPEAMFYRQAELFVRYLRDRDPAALEHLLVGLAHGDKFATAVTEAYKARLPNLWQDFIDHLGT